MSRILFSCVTTTTPLKSMLLCDILRESQTYNRKLVLVVTRLTESTTCISGVYLTSLGPENSTEKLVGNNWDDLKPTRALVKDKEPRTEWVVEVPQGRAKRVGRNRDVYLHKGDLILDSNCKIYRRSNPEVSRVKVKSRVHLSSEIRLPLFDRGRSIQPNDGTASPAVQQSGTL